MRTLTKIVVLVLQAGGLVSATLTPAFAGRQTDRTEAICKTPFATRQALANQGDPDGIYCLATLYAYRYGDDRIPEADRRVYREKAIPLMNQAEALGYDMRELDRWINSGDRIIAADNNPDPPPSVSGTLQPTLNCPNGGVSQSTYYSICY